MKKSWKIALFGLLIAVILWIADSIYGTYIYRSADDPIFTAVWFAGILALIIALVLTLREKANEDKKP